ncbi:hypothetical protein H2202_006981 [Exophiala xenobiotica]|nr:hypothetical protein H2202_006981 [Exophiala xenobiotica]
MPRGSSEAAQGGMTISAATQRCRLSLTQCLRIPLLMEREWAENKLADFNLWASGIGAAADYGDKISLDSRLSGKRALVDVFLRLLEMLLTFLEECQSLSTTVSVTASAKHPYWEAHGAQQASIRDDRGRTITSGPHQGSRASRSISPWSDQSSAASEPDVTTPFEKGGVVDAMMGVDSVIGQLNDLGVAVRRAGKQHRLQKADSRLDLSEHSDFEAFLRFWIQTQKRKHGDTAVEVQGHLTPIQLRLISVNLLRRNRFIYAQRRAQYHRTTAEVQQNSLPLLEESRGSLAQSLEDEGGHSHAVPTGQSAGSSPNLLGQKEEPVKDGEPPADASTATKLETATEILDKRLQGSESQMTSTAAKIRYPYPPKIRPGVRFFRCPCCCQTLDRAIAEGHRWRRHLAEDICPYTCICDTCPSPETTFVTRQAWIDHMEGEEHSVSKGWFCLICEASTEYRTESYLSAHYMKYHAEFITANQMQTLLDSSLLAFSTTPICCPLCDPSEEDPLERRPPDWDHIAEHVHAFALLSLPWGAADPVVQPQALHEACERVSSWLGSNARPTDSTSEVHALQIGLPNIGNQYFNEEPYFAESRGMRTETSIASTETDQGSEGPGCTSPLLFPKNNTATGSGTNILEAVDAFLQIPLGDWVACERFLARHGGIIVLADRDEILNQAWKSLERADLIGWKVCIERLVLIETCRTLTPKGREHLFTALEQPKSLERRHFYAACEREEDSLRARMERAYASGRSSPTISQASSEDASGLKEQHQSGAATSDESKDDKTKSESRATASTPRWLKKNEKGKSILHQLRTRLPWKHRNNEEANFRVLAEIRAALAQKYLPPAKDGPIFVHPDDARKVLKREHIRSLLSHFPWYRESDRDQVWKQMALILCILVVTDWLDWVRFKDYFYTVGRDLLYPKFDDSNLPLDDATEPFLPEVLWTSFLRDQYIFTPIFIHEDSHEKIYSAKFRLPILESTPVDEEGAQGKVYKIRVDGRFVTYGGGRINSNVQLMAMKRIAAKKQRDFRAETKALTHFTRCLLQSRNIMKSISSFVLGTDFVILSPWAEGKDLHQFLYYPDKIFPNFPELSRRFSPNNLLTEALSLAQALEFLHNQMTTDRGRKLRCAHLDLKPENILVCFPPDAHPDSCPVGQWKITDFGMAKIEQSVVGQEIVQEHQEQDPAPGNVLRDLSSQPPTRGEGAFQPPEVQIIEKAKVSTRRDVWSFGCVLAMVLAYALGGPEEVAKQHQSRAAGSDDYFYLRRRQPRTEARISASILHRVQAELKPEFQKWLDNAPAMRNAIHAEWIGACSQLVLSLLNVDVVQRPEIFTAIFHLGRIISHTEVHAHERMWEFGDASTAPEVIPTKIPQLAVRRSSNDSVSEISVEFTGVRSIATTSSAQSPQTSAPSSTSFTSFRKAINTTSFLNLEPPNKEVKVNKACLAPSGGWAALYSPTRVFTYDLKHLGDDPTVWTARPSNLSLPTEQQSLTSMQVIKGSQQSSIEQVLIRGNLLALVERTEKPSPSWSTRLFSKQNGKYELYRDISLVQKPEEIRLSARGRLAVKYTSYMHLYIPE